jgi:hypothetical protein
LQAKNDVAVEAEQRINGHQHYERDNYANERSPSRNDLRPVLFIRTGEREHPNPLGNAGHAEKGGGEQQTDEAVVVPAANAVIEELAVVVELVHAPVAGVAVVARFTHQMPALQTIPHPLPRPTLTALFQQTIDGVSAGEVEIVHRHEDEQKVGEAEQHPQYRRLLVSGGRCHKNAV